MQDYYNILGILPAATQKEIKSAFRRLAKQCHPDKVEKSCKKAAETKFKQIAEAYYILNDPVRRCEYDFSRKRITPSESKESSSAYSYTLTFDIDEIIGYAKEKLKEIDRGTFIVRFIFGSGLGIILGLFCTAPFSVNSKFTFVLFLIVPMLLFGLLSALLGDKFWFWIGRSLRWIVWR